MGKLGAPGRLGKLGAPEGGVTQTCTPFELLALSDTPAPLPDADTLTPADPGSGLDGGLGELTHWGEEALARPAVSEGAAGASIMPRAVPPPRTAAPAAAGSRLVNRLATILLEVGLLEDS